MCPSTKTPRLPDPPAPPPPAPPPPVEIGEVSARRRRQDTALGRQDRSETRRVDRASAIVVGDGSGLRL